MAILPDLDGLALHVVDMFEKADSFSASLGPPLARRAGDALRAVEWSEITARLNAARDLRLLVRSESQGRIDAVAASFGDAAARYFAMIEDHEPAINLDALDCSKACDGKNGAREAIPHDAASRGDAKRVADAPEGDARDEQ